MELKRVPNFRTIVVLITGSGSPAALSTVSTQSPLLPSNSLPVPSLAVPDSSEISQLFSTRTMEFCTGGLWPAIQSLVVFLTTNIFAHAATFYLPPGTPALRTAFLIISAIVSPVLLGDHAFRAIRRRRSRSWSQIKGGRKMRPTSLLGSDTFEDAVVSGALAICVPLEFAPVVRGCWGLAMPNELKMVLLDHTEVRNGPEQKLLGGPTFYENRPIPPYIPFILSIMGT